MTLEIGSYFVERRQPPLSDIDREIIQKFHDLYYRRWLAGADTLNLSWFGYHVVKCPLDLWIYQELLVRTKPDLIVETGTFRGGSALYLASVLDQIGKGAIASIGIEQKADRPSHPRVTYLTGSSTDPAVVAEVKRRTGSGGVMIVVDSDHHVEHVCEELLAYCPLVKPGDYLIVEDTNVNGHPTFATFGPGPMEAVERFLAQDNAFEIDVRCARFLMTLNPKGYLRRLKPHAPL